MEKDNFEIIDDNGVIYSGHTEEETYIIFQGMVGGDEQWVPENGWQGDLKLIQVHFVYR